MATTDSAKFIIRVGGKERCVLSVFEEPDGELLINLRANLISRAMGTLIELNTTDKSHGQPIAESRYSIHNSPKLPDQNVFKLKHILENGSETIGYHFTTAIKTTKQFTPLYSRRCSTCENSYYDVNKPAHQQVSLGEVPTKFTLIFGIFVGRSGVQFKAPNQFDFRVAQVQFSKFSLVMLRSYLLIPAHVSCFLRHVATTTETGPTEGLSASECVKHFKAEREFLKRELIVTLSGDTVGATAVPLMASTRFFREPRMDTVEFRKLAKLVQSGKVPLPDFTREQK